MKRLLFIILVSLSAAFYANAQIQRNPVANDDGTVTFTLKAPKAVTVKLSGNVFPQCFYNAPKEVWKETDQVDMVEGENGVWTYTTAQLDPDMYLYHFIVDGTRMPDPLNFQQVRDTDEWQNYFIFSKEKGDFGDQISNATLPHGTVSHVWYDSKLAGMARRMTVYTPAGYSATGSARYPVFYLLHGSGNDEDTWAEQARAIQTFDRMIAAGECKPMIVVMTNGHLYRDAAPGAGSILLDKPVCEMEDCFLDVVNYVEKNYRVRKDRNSRAIAGLSMGGGHTFRITLKYPDMFGYIGLFSASTRVKDFNDPEFRNSVKRLSDAKPNLYLIQIGENDFLYDINRDYREYLDSAGFDYSYKETHGGHVWRNWRHYLPEFCQKLF